MKNIQKGFTLLEAMIVIALLAVLASMAYPSFQNMISDNRAKAGVMTINKALSYTRSEANSRNRSIGLCPLAKAGGNTCGGNADWSNGFMAYIDKDRDHRYNATKDGKPIQFFKLKQPIHIEMNGNTSLLTWEAGGLKLTRNNNQPANISIKVMPSNNAQDTAHQKKCTIAASGRILCN